MLRTCLAACVLVLLLAGSGPAVPAAEQVQAHLAALKSPEPLVRLRAAKALGEMGAAAIPALPALEPLKQDPDEDVRTVARRAIEKISAAQAKVQPPPVSPAVQALITEMQSPDREARKAAIDALGSLGAVAKAALEPLQTASKDPDAVVRIAAMKATALIEADLQKHTAAQPPKFTDVAGKYTGAPLEPAAILQASWKRQVSTAIPGFFQFEAMPAADGRAKVRHIFDGSLWTFSDLGDITVQLNIPPDWERSFGNRPKVTAHGTMAAKEAALEFSVNLRGTTIATEINLRGKVRRHGQRTIVDAQLTLTGPNLLEANVTQTLQ